MADDANDKAVIRRTGVYRCKFDLLTGTTADDGILMALHLTKDPDGTPTNVRSHYFYSPASNKRVTKLMSLDRALVAAEEYTFRLASGDTGSNYTLGTVETIVPHWSLEEALERL